jgi:hypothetical protein
VLREKQVREREARESTKDMKQERASERERERSKREQYRQCYDVLRAVAVGCGVPQLKALLPVYEALSY